MISLRRIGDIFTVYSDEEYFGTMSRLGGTWTCCPEQRIKDIDTEMKLEIDIILRMLNNV